MFEDLTITDTDTGLNFELHLEPDRRVYCFIGDNGVGKTVLLESLGQICWYVHEMWRDDLSARQDGHQFRGLHTSVEVQKQILGSELRVRDSVWNSKTVKHSGTWGKHIFTSPSNAMPSTPQTIAVPIVFVSAHHRTAISSIDPERLSLLGSAETTFALTVKRGLDAVMRRPQDSATVAAWIFARLMLNPDFYIGFRPAHQEVVDLCKLLQHFDDETFKGLVSPVNDKVGLNLVYKNGKLLFLNRPLEALAHGWIALIKIFQEIISTISAWEQVRGSKDILNSDALIFIDELDAHLHPRWQVKLIPFLKKEFPRATFFLATHSPLLVRDTEEGEAYELVRTGNTVKSRKIGNPRDWFLADIYSQAFHVNLPPPGSEGEEGASLESLMMEYVEKVRDFTAGSRAEAREEALAIFEKLSTRLPEDDPRKDTLLRLKGMLK